MADKKKHINPKRVQSLLNLALLSGIIIFINILANARLGERAFYTPLDLTEGKRFTLPPATKNLLRELDELLSSR